jgi:hypothetical protein
MSVFLCKRGMLLAEIIMLTGIVFHRPSVFFFLGVIANKIWFWVLLTYYPHTLPVFFTPHPP